LTTFFQLQTVNIVKRDKEDGLNRGKVQIGKEESLAVLKELSQPKEQVRKCPHDEAFKDTFAVLVIK
jgi:hypothetical protein